MKLEFSDILNRESGKTGFVLGLGPSLRAHLPMLKQAEKDKSKNAIISCNNIDLMTDIDFDYWMLAQPAEESNPFCIKNGWRRYNARKNTLFMYTDCLDLTPRSTVADLLTCDYIGYDQRHYNNEPCGWGTLPGGHHTCCAAMVPGRLNIQEEFKKYIDTHIPPLSPGENQGAALSLPKGEAYGCGDTVGVHMVALAVMLGLNPIYITGIDLDYTQGYVNNDVDIAQFRTQLGMSNMNHVPAIIERILADYRLINDCAKRIRTKIYCLDKGLKISDIFEYGIPENY